jgi:hypothetical protein
MFSKMIRRAADFTIAIAGLSWFDIVATSIKVMHRTYTVAPTIAPHPPLALCNEMNTTMPVAVEYAAIATRAIETM